MSDELLEMQKDTFKWFLYITWPVWVYVSGYFILAYLEPNYRFFVWLGIGPALAIIHWLSTRYFRLATWLWVSMFVLVLVIYIPWQFAPNLGPLPYAFILLVVVSSVLISREATLYVAGMASLLSLLALAMSDYFRPFNTQAVLAVTPPLIMMWLVAVLGWLVSDQLVTALMWTRNAQVEASQQAEHLRQSRDEFQKSLLIRNNLDIQLQAMHQQAMRRALQLETVAEVSRRITALLDLKQVLAEVTNLICDRFGYDYCGVFLLEADHEDPTQSILVLRGAGGERGEAMMARGLQLVIDKTSINGYAVSAGRTHCVNDVTMVSAYRWVDLLRDTISELAIPLRVGEHIVGSLDVQTKQVNAFTRDDIATLEGLAAQVAIAIQNTRLYESEQTRRQVAETLRKVGRILGSTLDVDEVLDRLLEQLAVVVPYSRAAVMLQSGDTMYMAASRGHESPSKVQAFSVDIHENDVFSQVSRSRQALVISDIETFPGWKQADWLPLDHSWVGAPLIVQSEVIGMLSLTRAPRGAFSQDEGAIVFTFANQAAIAIHNARLYEQIQAFNVQLEHKVQERAADLQKAYAQLERLDRSKTDFIDIVAHELRTPLTVMQGYVAMMSQESEVQASPFLSEAVSGVVKGTERLYEVVNSMLDVARIDSQALDLYLGPTRLADVMERLRAEFSPALAERHLTLTLHDLDHLPIITADASKLRKVFYHILVNAIKYTPDGGDITVNGQLVQTQAQSEVIQISVCDTGIGIDPKHHDMIFEKFYQIGEVALHSSGRTKFKGGGAGLGLAIARGIVLAHKGRIWVESPGYNEETCPGACFYVQLPAPSSLSEKAG